jgi:apolipoprotein N-acyltransferase
VLLIGFWTPPPVRPEPATAIVAAVVQGEEINFEEYEELTEKVMGSKPKLIVWPEYALPYDVRKDEPEQVEKLRALAATHDSVLIVGTKTRTGPGDREWRNTALAIGRDGVLGEYYKNRPVHFFNDGIAGTSAEPIHTPIGSIGAAVCFDCDYEAICRELVRKGAEILVAPTFDAVFWSETQHQQHAVFFRIRAAENGRWLACTASSGYSRIIDPHGNIHETLPYATTEAVAGLVELRSGRTLYNRFGWLAPWTVLLIAIGMTGSRLFPFDPPTLRTPGSLADDKKG